MFSLLNFSCLISIDRHPFLRHIFLCFLFYFEIITPSFPVFFSNSLSKSLFYHYVSLKIGQKLVIFRSNFCPQTTTSCGLTCLFFFFPTILHQNYRLHMPRIRKHIHTTALLHLIPSLLQSNKVSGKRSRLAGNVHHSVNTIINNLLKCLRVDSVTRWVKYDKIWLNLNIIKCL